MRSPTRRHWSRRSSRTSACATRRRASSQRRIADAEHLRGQPLNSPARRPSRPDVRATCREEALCLPRMTSAAIEAILLQSSACDRDAEHKSHAPRSIRCFVLTVSDTRTEQNDTQRRRHRRPVARGRAPGDRTDDCEGRSDRWCADTVHGQIVARRRAGGDHDGRHRHHVARQHLRSDFLAAREAARRIRRAVPDAQLRRRSAPPPC